MSDPFKLARGSARLRALAAAGVVMATAACNPEESSAPTAGEAGVTTVAATPAFLTSASAPGIPFGDFHLPVEEFDNPRYTGSLQALWPSSTYSRLDAARSNGRRVIISLAGSPKYYRNSDGTFNLTKWKSRIDVYRGDRGVRTEVGWAGDGRELRTSRQCCGRAPLVPSPLQYAAVSGVTSARVHAFLNCASTAAAALILFCARSDSASPCRDQPLFG